MVTDDQIAPPPVSNLEAAWLATDGKIKGITGHTTRERCSILIMNICGISESTWCNWRKDPKLVRRHIDRYHIAIVFNQPVNHLFPHAHE